MNERTIPLAQGVREHAWDLAIARAGNGKSLAETWPRALAEVALLAEQIEQGGGVAIPEGVVAQIVQNGPHARYVKFTPPPGLPRVESHPRGK